MVVSDHASMGMETFQRTDRLCSVKFVWNRYPGLNHSLCHLFKENTDKIRKHEGQIGPGRGGLVSMGTERMWGKGIEGEHGANAVHTCM
jgi:hypothetical protein